MRAAISIKHIPFLRILPVVVSGILVANAVSIPLWIVISLLIISAGVAAVFHKREWSSWAVAASLFTFSMGVTYVAATKDVMPKDEKVIAALHITDTPVSAGRWMRAGARVDKFRSAGEETMWRRSGEKVIIRFDTTHHISAGDRIITEAWIRPVADTAYADYGRLMRRRGYSASAWVYGNSPVVTLSGKALTPAYYASRMQATASQRMDKLQMRPQNLAVAKAMTIGAREELSSTLRQTYSMTGGSHLLAVSGLHVGIVALLVNALLWLLPVFRSGHMVRNVVAVTAIWAYAMLTGFSPSVVRAALMFTGMQMALFSSQRYDGVNILLGTATVMLLINPNYLYDISFQLSFAAVLGIMIVFRPLYGMVKTKHKWLNAILSVILIGIAATIATAPLVSYYFGSVPLIGIVINPAVIVTAHITVLFSLLWIIAPAGFLGGVFSWIINAAAGAQNAIVEFSAGQWWASAPIRLSGWQVLLVYLSIGVIAYMAHTLISARRKPAYSI